MNKKADLIKSIRRYRIRMGILMLLVCVTYTSLGFLIISPSIVAALFSIAFMFAGLTTSFFISADIKKSFEDIIYKINHL